MERVKLIPKKIQHSIKLSHHSNAELKHGAETLIQDLDPSAVKLKCSKCGATAVAWCKCGVAYVPAGERAAKAVADNLEKSDRAIAAEIGVGSNTVRRARKTGAPHGAPAKSEKRTGKDGKKYPSSIAAVATTDPPKLKSINGHDVGGMPSGAEMAAVTAAHVELDKLIERYRDHLPEHINQALDATLQLLSGYVADLRRNDKLQVRLQ
jgi:hypothetical protein